MPDHGSCLRTRRTVTSTPSTSSLKPFHESDCGVSHSPPVVGVGCKGYVDIYIGGIMMRLSCEHATSCGHGSFQTRPTVLLKAADIESNIVVSLLYDFHSMRVPSKELRNVQAKLIRDAPVIHIDRTQCITLIRQRERKTLLSPSQKTNISLPSAAMSNS